MAFKLRDLKSRGPQPDPGRAIRRRRWPRTTTCWRRTRSTATADGKIADLLWRLGDEAGAVEVYRAVAMHDVRSGHLLPAIVGCKVLESLGQNIDDIVATMARNFAHGAPDAGQVRRAAGARRSRRADRPAATRGGGRRPPSWRRARRPARSISRSSRSTRSSSCRSPFFSELPPRAVSRRDPDGAPGARRGRRRGHPRGRARVGVLLRRRRGDARRGRRQPIDGRPTKAVELTRSARGGAVRRDGAAHRPAAHGLGPGGGRGRSARGRAAPPSPS